MSIPLGSIASGYQRGLTTSQGVLSPAQISDYRTQLLILLSEIQKSKNTLAEAEVSALSEMEKERAAFELALVKEYFGVVTKNIEAGKAIQVAKISSIVGPAADMYFSTTNKFATKIQKNTIQFNTVAANESTTLLPPVLNAMRAEQTNDDLITAEIDNYIRGVLGANGNEFRAIQTAVAQEDILDKGKASLHAKKVVAKTISLQVRNQLLAAAQAGTLPAAQGQEEEFIQKWTAKAYQQAVLHTGPGAFEIEGLTTEEQAAAHDKEQITQATVLKHLDKSFGGAGASPARAMEGALAAIGYDPVGPQDIAESLIALREARVQQDPVTQFLTDKLMEQYTAADDLGKDDFDRQSERIQALPLYNELTMALGLNNKYQVASFVGSSPQALRQAYRALEDSAQREHQRKLIEAAQAGEVLLDINRPKDIIATYRNNPALVQQALGSQLGVKETPFKLKSALRQKARTEMIDLPALMGLTEEVEAEEVEEEEVEAEEKRASREAPAPAQRKPRPLEEIRREYPESDRKGPEQPDEGLAFGFPTIGSQAPQTMALLQGLGGVGGITSDVTGTANVVVGKSPINAVVRNDTWYQKTVDGYQLITDPKIIDRLEKQTKRKGVYRFKKDPTASGYLAPEMRQLEKKGLEYRVKNNVVEYRFAKDMDWKKAKSSSEGGTSDQDQAYRYSKRALKERKRPKGQPYYKPNIYQPTTPDTPFSIEGIPMIPKSMQGSDPFKQYEYVPGKKEK